MGLYSGWAYTQNLMVMNTQGAFDWANPKQEQTVSAMGADTAESNAFNHDLLDLLDITQISRRGKNIIAINRKSHQGCRNSARAHEQNQLKTKIAGEHLTKSQTAPAARSSETEQLEHAPSARKSDSNQTPLLRAILFQNSPIERTLNDS